MYASCNSAEAWNQEWVSSRERGQWGTRQWAYEDADVSNDMNLLSGRVKLLLSIKWPCHQELNCFTYQPQIESSLKFRKWDNLVVKLCSLSGADGETGGIEHHRGGRRGGPSCWPPSRPCSQYLALTVPSWPHLWAEIQMKANIFPCPGSEANIWSPLFVQLTLFYTGVTSNVFICSNMKVKIWEFSFRARLVHMDFRISISFDDCFCSLPVSISFPV